MGQAGYGVAGFVVCLIGVIGTTRFGPARAQAPEESAPPPPSPASEPARASDATAAPGSVQLQWRVPEGSGCASEDEMRAQIERLSERAPLSPGGAPAAHTIDASIEPFETTWRARIALHDAAGQALGAREVLGRSPTCRTLNVPVALVIVTLIDSLQSGGAAALAAPRAALPPSPKPIVKGTSRLRDPTARPGSRSDRAAPHGPRFGLGAFAALAVGIVPSPALGAGAMFELRTPLPIALDASVYLPVDELDAQGRGAQFVLWHAGLGLCPELIVARSSGLRAQICAAGELGAISAAGRGLTHASRATRLVAFAAIEPKLVWLLGESLSLRASLLAGWVIERPRFSLDIEGQPPKTLQSDPAMLLVRIGVMGFAL